MNPELIDLLIDKYKTLIVQVQVIVDMGRAMLPDGHAESESGLLIYKAVLRDLERLKREYTITRR